MSLDKKQIRYWIRYYCGGTHENQDIVADLIMKKIKKEQLITHNVIDLLTAWEQFKKSNWWQSEAVDVEKVLMDKFSSIHGR